MRWKELLNLDLGALLRRRPDARVAAKPVYWWTRIGQLGSPRAASSTASTRVLPEIPPSLRLTAEDPAWRGPVYWNARTWRRDVILVAEHLRSLIACNAPLAPGLAACAQEDVRARRTFTPQRVSLMARLGVATVLLLALGVNIAESEGGLDSPYVALQSLTMVAIAIWMMKSVVARRHGRAGVLLALEHRIACGSGLSEAMGSLPRFFPRHLVDLVEAGEVTGSLDPAFDQFNDTMLRSLGIHRRLRTLFWYLGIVFSAQILITVFLMIKVVPVFVEIRQEAAGEIGITVEAIHRSSEVLPLVDALLPGLDFLIATFERLMPMAPYIGVALLLAIAWAVLRRFRLRRRWSARRTSSVLAWLPWFRGLLVRHNLGQIALMLHGLLRAGVPLDRALALTMASDVHPVYRRWLGQLRERVCQGDSLKEALGKTVSRRFIPASFTGLVEAGERSGQLPETLAHVAALYQRDTEKRLAILQALVLPVGILVVGYLVMTTQVAVFRVLIDLTEVLNV